MSGRQGGPHDVGTARTTSGPSASDGGTADEIASVDRAIAALEAQREVLGDAVVDTALDPLRARRAELERSRTEQRRLVTVVFADLVDFTVLSRQLDAEDTREVVNAYFARWQRAIEDHGGVVEKFIGDAVMAVFGLSRSYEDDAHRAIRSALAMLADLDDLNADLVRRFGVTLHMRVGIDTGEVVVSTLGERAGGGFVAVGPSVNRASRIQAAAPVDRVLISSETQRLVRGVFDFEAPTSLQLKGIDEPVEAVVVVKERRHEFRLDPNAVVEGIETSTVGRDLALRFLQDRLWDIIDESRWRVVTVMGDAGVGKSRLLYDFDAWVADRPESVWWFRGRAAPSGQHGVNVLLRDLLTSRLDISIDDPSDVVRKRLTDGFVSAVGPEAGPRQAALVGAWLGFDVQDGSFDLPSEPQALRDQGTEVLGEYFRALGRQAPVLMLLEDLHWADEGTLRWLDAVAPVLAESKVLIVATTRPSLLENHPRWGEGLAHHVRLTLNPLSRRESRALVRQILRNVEDLPDDLVSLVIDSAEGNPFYIEELVTWLMDAGVVVRAEPKWFVVHELVRTVAVPSTLKGLLQSRLDSLSAEERRLVQRASVVGRVFWDLAVAHLGGGRETDVTRARASLENLRRREVVLQREVSQFASAREYLFKHALLRDVAYDGVLRAQRERYHRRAAAWLAETSAAVGRADEYAAVIADHFERAHDPDAAIWYLRAGTQATSVYALSEATRMLDSALAHASDRDQHLRFDILLAQESLLDRRGERESQQRVLDSMVVLIDHVDPARRVQLDLAQSRIQFTHSEYEKARHHADRAVEVASEIGDHALRAEATLAQGKALTWAAEGEGAQVTLTRAVELAREIGRPALIGEGLRYLSMLASNNGDFPASLAYFAEAREVFARTGDSELESTALAQVATTYFNLGWYAEAQAALEETLPIFRRSGHRYRETVNLGNLASIALVRNQLASAEKWAREAVENAEELEELEAGATYKIVLGAVSTLTSRFEVARTQLAEASSVAHEVHSEALEGESLARMSTIELVTGNHQEALDLARRAVAAAARVTSELDRGFTQQALGLAAAAMGSWDEAETAFAEAHRLFEILELDSLVREATVGLGSVAAARGQLDAAVGLIGPVLEHLDTTGLSQTWEPGQMLLCCHRILVEAGDPRAAAVLDQARSYVRAMAEEVGDPDLAAGYLVYPPHAALLAQD